MDIKENEILGQELKVIGREYGTTIKIIDNGIAVPTSIVHLPKADQILISKFLVSPLIEDDFTLDVLRESFCKYLGNMNPKLREYYKSNALLLINILTLKKIIDLYMFTGLTVFLQPYIEKYNTMRVNKKVDFVKLTKISLLAELENRQQVVK